MEFLEEGHFDELISTRKKTCRQLAIGNEMAETSHGLFSPDDWQCRKCGNVNWARRYKCNVCREPKYPKVEARTGLGGGYDDRGVVEYVRREESDEEYDHFGRRRKRKRTEHSAHEIESEGGLDKQQRSAEGNVVDEDEEEDEDGDLSKYDIAELEETMAVEPNNKCIEDSRCPLNRDTTE